jgi:adenylate cyclase
MGSSMRKNYTMMGDAVNLAARLESAAKQYGAYIQISEDTQSHLDNTKYIYRSLDTIRVVGKSQPVKTFELLERSGCENEVKLRKLVEIWEQGRAAYLNMEWDKAIALFTQCLDYEPHLPERDPGSKTCPSTVYIARCENYKVNPPVAEGETWDGVFTATSK